MYYTTWVLHHCTFANLCVDNAYSARALYFLYLWEVSSRYIGRGEKRIRPLKTFTLIFLLATKPQQ